MGYARSITWLVCREIGLQQRIAAMVFEALAEASHSHSLHVLLDLALANRHEDVHALVDLVFATTKEHGEGGIARQATGRRVLPGCAADDRAFSASSR